MSSSNNLFRYICIAFLRHKQPNMKKLLPLLYLLMAAANAFTQNVGIGTTSPVVALDVHSGVSYAARFNSVTNNMYIGLSESNTLRGYIGSYAGANEDVDFGTASGNTAGKLHLTVQSAPKMTVDNAGNIGIGTTTPGYKLDVAGRVRLQHSGGNTAGIWLDGTTLPTRSFIGTVNDDHVGVYGNGGTGWNLVMNVNNGNTGIGTAAPTARLDVNGTLRFRGSFPKKGSVLTSEDANGNASWTDPMAFKVSGRNTDAMSSLPVGAWTKWWFANTAEYNVGLVFQPLQSQLVALEDGIYHFDAQIQLSGYGDNFAIRLRRSRDGIESTLTEHNRNYNLENPPTLTDVIFIDANQISTDVKLNAGDTVWLEIFFETSYVNNPFPPSSTDTRTWFSGHLVARL